MPEPVAIAVQVPSVLREYAGGAAEVSVPAGSLQGVLDELHSRYPDLHRSICNETGAVRQHVNVFVNSQLVRDRAALEAPLAAGDVVTVFQAVSGG